MSLARGVPKGAPLVLVAARKPHEVAGNTTVFLDCGHSFIIHRSKAEGRERMRCIACAKGSPVPPPPKPRAVAVTFEARDRSLDEAWQAVPGVFTPREAATAFAKVCDETHEMKADGRRVEVRMGEIVTVWNVTAEPTWSYAAALVPAPECGVCGRCHRGAC